MSDLVRIIIAICVIVILIVIFVVTFILYKRTPPPKGCSDIHPSEAKCHGCKETSCHFNLYYNMESEDDKKMEDKDK